MSPELLGFKSAVEDALRLYLPSRSPIAQSLVDAMRHAALGGGKRLRPLFVCAACTGLGGRLEDALAPACAVEFIHAYSLIHDDLPSMDDDALRHGLPSCHVVYGEATAILAGDALQALAFETLAGAPGASPEVRVAALQTLGKACGWAGLVGGQSFDLASEGRSLPESRLRELHAAKTGALIRAAVELGAIFAGADDEPRQLVAEYAVQIGLAFQIVDDVLDVTQSTETLGKPARSDQQANKSTFPALMGEAPALDLARGLLDEALEFLTQAGLRDGPLAELARMAVERRH